MVVELGGFYIDTDSEFFTEVAYYKDMLTDCIDSLSSIKPQLATEKLIGVIETQPKSDRVRSANIAEYICESVKKVVEERRRAHLAGVNAQGTLVNAEDIFIDECVCAYNAVEDDLNRCTATWKSYINQY